MSKRAAIISLTHSEPLAMDPLDLFAAEALRFETWATSTGLPDEKTNVHEALIRLTSLYLAALHLPATWSEELDGQPEVEDLPAAEMSRVTIFRSLPIDYYSDLFYPVIAPPGKEELITAHIADDILDIYRDVITGLRAYQSGNRAQALYEWKFNLASHWGRHITGAIRALHCWLADNGMDDC